MTKPTFGGDRPRCNWQIESDNPDNPPHLCGRPAVAVYRRYEKRPAVAQTYHRCVRHDTEHAQAIIEHSPDMDRKELPSG
jgi:hypothetical protein